MGVALFIRSVCVAAITIGNRFAFETFAVGETSEFVHSQCPAVLLNALLQTPACILLENVSAKFTHPCILDVKIGTRLHGDDCPVEKLLRHQEKNEMSTTSSLGLRLTGLQVKSSQAKKLFVAPAGRNIHLWKVAMFSKQFRRKRLGQCGIYYTAVVKQVNCQALVTYCWDLNVNYNSSFELKNHCIICKIRSPHNLYLWNRNPNFRLRLHHLKVSWFRLQPSKIAWAPAPQPWLWHPSAFSKLYSWMFGFLETRLVGSKTGIDFVSVFLRKIRKRVTHIHVR